MPLPPGRSTGDLGLATGASVALLEVGYGYGVTVRCRGAVPVAVGLTRVELC